MTNSIVIELRSSDHNSDVPVGELVQQGCYDELKEKICSDLKKVKAIRENSEYHSDFFDKYPPGSGLVYFIDGTRGAGKTTFLRAAFKGLSGVGKEGNNHAVKNLVPLAYIDPSNLENNEIILLTLLKELTRIIEKQKSSLQSEESYKAFRENFKKLAGGLSLFVKDHHPLQHLDPELFLDHGLNRAGHSKDLRRHLHEVLDCACKLLGTDSLLIGFDDTDTNASHARKVLECIRNYLDTPQLVILVTGDLELYSLLVRDHFFDNLRHSQYDKDEERHQQRVRMVDHLEDQYLLKLFPIHRRLQLRPLGSLLKVASCDYVLAHHDWSDKRTPLEVLDELIRRGLRIKNEADIALYREFLLQQPLRSVLQLLSSCARHLSVTNEDGKAARAWNNQLSEALCESLRGMALGSLYKFRVNVDALAGKDLPALIDAVFELSLRDGDSDTAAYLRPQTKEDDLKSCFTTLAAEVAGQCVESPSAAILYLLGGPGSISLFGKEVRRNEKNIDRDILCQQFRQYMGVGRREDALNWARHASAVIAATHRQGGILIEVGVIGLNKSKPGNATKGKNPEIFAGFDVFSTHFKNRKLPVFALSLVDLSGSSSGTTYASIYNILGIIERVLVADDISQVLKKPYPSLSVSRPEWGSGWSGSVDDDEDYDAVPKITSNGRANTDQSETVNENTETETPTLPDDVISEIRSWKNTFNKEFDKLTPSAVMLGKVWTRLYFSLENASNSLRPVNTFGAASIMEIFALCVINAFLIEEVEHHLVTESSSSLPPIDRTNPQTSAKDFINKKIAFLAKNKNNLPFTYAIATCPLIVGLIKPTSVAVSRFSELLGDKNGKATVASKKKSEKLLCSSEDWRLIENSFIAGRCKKPSGEK